MPGGMPYHLEKGVTLRLIERHLNGTWDDMAAKLSVLRNATSPIWVEQLAPDLWDEAGFGLRHTTGGDVLTHIWNDWFGVTPPREGAASWQPVAKLEHCTGHWIAYNGDVEVIVRKALIWALELALGIPRGGDPAQFPGTVEPRPIELFWKCPCPWFEAWVVCRPGPVTVLFLTPSHVGSNVAESPLAAPTAGLSAHPVPGAGADYERLPDDEAPTAATTTTSRAHLRQHATWIVTHEDHETTAETVTITTGAADFAEWGIPKVSVYKGTGRIVTVSPAFTAGGVTKDGRIPTASVGG